MDLILRERARPVLLMPLAHAAGSVFLVYALQHLWNLGPTAAGALSAVMAVSWSFTAIAVASIGSRALRHRLLLAGPVLLTAGLVGLTVASASGLLWLVGPAQIAVGALALYDSICAAQLGDVIASLSMEGLTGLRNAFDPRIHQAGLEFAVSASSRAISRNTRRMTLPVVVSGISSTNATSRG